MDILRVKNLEEILSIIRNYRNWREIISLTMKGKKPTRVTLRNGIQIDVPPENHSLLTMVNEIFIRNYYTPVNLTIESTDIVVDIGANVGIFNLQQTEQKMFMLSNHFLKMLNF